MGLNKIPLDPAFTKQWTELAKSCEFRGTQLNRLNRDELLAVCAFTLEQLNEAQRLLGEAISADSSASV